MRTSSLAYIDELIDAMETRIMELNSELSRMQDVREFVLETPLEYESESDDDWEFVGPVNGVMVPVEVREWMKSDEGEAWLDEYYQMAFDEGVDNGFGTGVVYGGVRDGD